MNSSDMVLHSIEDGIARITLNRPDSANALLPEQRDRLIKFLGEADQDPGIRVVVIASRGRHFCAGGDTGFMRKGIGGDGPQMRPGDAMKLMMAGAQRLVASILDCAKPVIAAVQGTAAGMGAHLAFACDLVVASEEASFVESFVLRGMVPDAGGAYMLPRRIGLQKAKELVFLGDKLSAREAWEHGLVNKVVPATELEETVNELAARLAAGPTLAIGLAKRLLNQSLDADRASAFLNEAMAQEIASTSADAKEGVMAFIEKREAKFQGH